MKPHSKQVMPTAATAGGAGGGAMRSVPQTLQNRASSGFSALQFEQIFAIPSLCLLIQTTIPWFVERGKPRTGFKVHERSGRVRGAARWTIASHRIAS
jgi:hypothetical protein